MYKYTNAFTNRSGDALPGYFARLYDSDGNQVDLFADASGTPIATISGVANAALSDDNGMFRWFVANGTYDIRFYDSNDVFVAPAEIGVPMIDASGVYTDLSGDDGATLVGTPTGTVQDDIDARPTAAVLAAPTGGEMVGLSTGETVADHVGEVMSLIAADALNTNAVSTNFGLGTLALAGAASGNGQNTAMGYEALTASTTAFSNVAIGHLTLKSVTNDGGGLGYGSNQVAIGAGTLRDCTTGQSNTAVGRACMPTATTASYNAVFGHAAGFSITTGFYNCAFGSDSLGLCTTGSRNTAAGFLALGANVSGNDNVALGYHASKLATTASRTIAIGAQSLQNNTADNVIAIGFTAGLSNTSGVQNLFIGRQTGYSCDTGGQNVALGENALFSATGAASNTAVGVNALFSNISSENTSLGAGTGNAGATGAADVTGGGNTFIGHRASGSTASAAGTLALGKDAVATTASGATSADNGPGIAIGAASTPVGFRGDGTIYPSAGASAGYMRVKINGTHYKIQLFADV